MPFTQVTVARRIGSGTGKRLVDPAKFEIGEPYGAVDKAVQSIIADLHGDFEVTGREEVCSISVITESTDLKIDEFTRSLHEKVKETVDSWKTLRREGDGSPESVLDWQAERDADADLQ